MIKKRNLLCLLDREKLDLGRLLLYEPYKNILVELKELCISHEKKEFDPVAKIFHGLLSTPIEIREYYEALIGVTSYYQHSQGGKGRYIEKKLANAYKDCVLDIELSKLPFWFQYPQIYKKKGLFKIDGLSKEERNLYRTFEWDWIGDTDVNTDLGSIIYDEKTVVLCEIKNAVDSGGVSARREIWTSEKFGIYINYLNPGEKIFRISGKELSLIDVLAKFGFNALEIYIGILFDKNDFPATKISDQTKGFYSSNKQGYEYIRNIIKNDKNFQIISEDPDNLIIQILINSKFKTTIGALYGNDITLKLFRKSFSVSDLLLLKYDDIWFSLLLTIDERMILLKNSTNFMTIFLDLLKRDVNLRELYVNLLEDECSLSCLKQTIDFLKSHYSNLFPDNLIPVNKDKYEYLADIIQFLCACEV